MNISLTFQFKEIIRTRFNKLWLVYARIEIHALVFCKFM